MNNKSIIRYPKKKKRTYNEVKNSSKEKPIKRLNKKFKPDNNIVNLPKTDIKENSFIYKKFNMKDIYLDIEKKYYHLIEIPNNDTFNDIDSISKRNYHLYYFIVKHLDIEKRLLKKIKASKDGNFFLIVYLFFLLTMKNIIIYLGIFYMHIVKIFKMKYKIIFRKLAIMTN